MSEATKCEWCGEPILPGEPAVLSDGDPMHFGCAVEELDNVCFDRDMEKS